MTLKHTYDMRLDSVEVNHKAFAPPATTRRVLAYLISDGLVEWTTAGILVADEHGGLTKEGTRRIDAHFAACNLAKL